MGGDKICIAGYLTDCTCVRPVTNNGLRDNFLRENGEIIIQPFAIVELDLDSNRTSNKPHTEDREICSLHRANRGSLTLSQRELFLSRIDNKNVESIFGAAISFGPGYYINDGEGDHSLGTIGNPKIIKICSDLYSNGYKINFIDNCGKSYELKVTDLSFWKYLDTIIYRDGMHKSDALEMLNKSLQQAKVYLRIGLAR